jgi:hypothetical protein
MIITLEYRSWKTKRPGTSVTFNFSTDGEIRTTRIPCSIPSKAATQPERDGEELILVIYNDRLKREQWERLEDMTACWILADLCPHGSGASGFLISAWL